MSTLTWKRRGGPHLVGITMGRLEPRPRVGSAFSPVILEGRRKFDRLAVRRIEIGAPPFLLALAHVLAADKFLFSAYPLQGVEPMLVVGITQVRITPFLRRLDLLAQGRHPFGPSEAADFRQTHRQCEGFRLPWFVEDRPFLVAGKHWEIINSHSAIPLQTGSK